MEAWLSCLRFMSQLEEGAEAEHASIWHVPQLQEVPECDEAGVEEWEEEHAHDHPPKPVVHTHLPPPDFG